MTIHLYTSFLSLNLAEQLPPVELILPVVAVTWGRYESGCDWINSQVPKELNPEDFHLSASNCSLENTEKSPFSMIYDTQQLIQGQEGSENFAFQCSDYIAVSKIQIEEK